MYSHARYIAFAGLFIAVSVILTRFGSFHYLPYLRVGFRSVPLLLSGFMLGPIYGAICGILSDLVGFFINGYGGFPHPGITLTTALTGALPGLLAPLYMNKQHSKKQSFLSLMLIVAITELVVSVFLNSIWLAQLTGNPLRVVLPIRLAASVVIVPIYTLLLKPILNAARGFINHPGNS